MINSFLYFLNEELTKLNLRSNVPYGMKKPNSSTGIANRLFHKVYLITITMILESQQSGKNLVK